MQLDLATSEDIARIEGKLDALATSLAGATVTPAPEWVTMRQHDKPRRGWTLRGFLALAIIAVVALWAGVALSQTHDSAGRVILEGDVTARPAPHHSGGGPTGAAARYFLSIAAEGPFRVSGRWFSSGTFVLALVAGPDAMRGSCIDPQVVMSFHRPTVTRTGETYASVYTDAFLPGFGQHLLALIESGALTHWRQRHYTALDLADWGYPICEEEQ